MALTIDRETKRIFIRTRLPAAVFALISFTSEMIQEDGFQFLTDLFIPLFFVAFFFLTVFLAREDPADTGELWQEWTNRGDSSAHPSTKRRRLSAGNILGYAFVGLFLLIGLLIIISVYLGERAVAGIN